MRVKMLNAIMATFNTISCPNMSPIRPPSMIKLPYYRTKSVMAMFPWLKQRVRGEELMLASGKRYRKRVGRHHPLKVPLVKVQLFLDSRQGNGAHAEIGDVDEERETSTKYQH